MDLIWVRTVIKNPFDHMDRVGYDNNFGDIIDGAYLIDTASDSKQFSFCTSNKQSMMNSFDKWSID